MRTFDGLNFKDQDVQVESGDRFYKCDFVNCRIFMNSEATNLR
jgi:hypothetical protein